jgi:hypothetical protein
MVQMKMQIKLRNLLKKREREVDRLTVLDIANMLEISFGTIQSISE